MPGPATCSPFGISHSTTECAACVHCVLQGGYAPTYSVAKALLNRGVQLMAADSAFKERGVSVVSVCPGWCRWVAVPLCSLSALFACLPCFLGCRRQHP